MPATAVGENIGGRQATSDGSFRHRASSDTASPPGDQQPTARIAVDFPSLIDYVYPLD
jgi:hypothetical protein